MERRTTLTQPSTMCRCRATQRNGKRMLWVMPQLMHCTATNRQAQELLRSRRRRSSAESAERSISRERASRSSKTIQRRRRYERDAATEELGVLQRQIGSFGLPKARATQAMTSIKTAINAMADHLSDTLTHRFGERQTETRTGRVARTQRSRQVSFLFAPTKNVNGFSLHCWQRLNRIRSGHCSAVPTKRSSA